MARHLITSDVAIRTAKAGDKDRRLNDGGGLFLLIKTNGARWWRQDYVHAGKRKTLSLGTYPDVGLKVARERSAEVREAIAQGVDPSDLRKQDRQQRATSLEIDRRIAEGLPPLGSFEAVAREWFEKFSANWKDSHSIKIIRRLEADVFPWIGSRPIEDIEALEILKVLNRIESRGATDTAHRVLQNCGQVFRYAIATGRARRNPCPDLRGALPPVKQQHYAALTSPVEFAKLLRAIDIYKGHFVTQCALKIAPLVFVRPGELRQAEWSEINFEKAEWNIPAAKMKMGEPHLVPLAHQTLAILRELHSLTGHDTYVFPCARKNGSPMSDNAILKALRRMGYRRDQMSGHGFRAIARTLLDEELQVRPDYIEHQLAHAVRDPNGRAYNRTAHISERRKMMQQWADYLDLLKSSVVI